MYLNHICQNLNLNLVKNKKKHIIAFFMPNSNVETRMHAYNLINLLNFVRLVKIVD